MRFFVIADNYCEDGSEFYFEPSESSAFGEPPRCQRCGNFVGPVPLLPPISGKLVATKNLFDFARSGGDEVILSGKCMRVFAENGIVGMGEPYQIALTELEGPHSIDSAGPFFLARAAHWGADVDRVKSGIRPASTHPCETCGFAGLIDAYEHVAIVDDSWQGQDVFTIKGLPGVVLVTNRVKDLCVQFGLSWCCLVPAEDFRVGGASRSFNGSH